MAQDNYGWLVVRDAPEGRGAKRAVVVDPTAAGPVLRALKAHGATLVGVLATHHHGDHVGGIAGLMEALEGPIVAGHSDVAARRIPHGQVGLEDGQDVTLAGCRFTAMHLPGHTLGATAFYAPSLKAVFVGDTLFSAGCGRLFEGTPQAMWASLKRLRALPPETELYVGHEYTVKNLEFALSVWPDFAPAQAALQEARARRRDGLPTVPTIVAHERQCNLFLRADDGALQARLGVRDDVAAFAHLRALRDRF